MALSRIVYPGDGVTTQFAIPFALGYIKRSDITARVGDEVDGTGEPIYRALTWISDELVDVAGAATPADSRIVFTRTTTREQLLVDYEDGDIINEENMNTAQKQALMLVHEVLDGRFEAFQSDLDLGGFRVVNVGDPLADGDLITLGYAKVMSGNAVSAAAQAAAARDAAIAAAGSANSSASAASSSASAAAASAVTAGNAETAASGSASAAAASATTAGTQAGNAANSATAASGSATAAEGSATAAQGSATTASNAATTATGAATTATTKANEAAASAAAALVSENNVATASVPIGMVFFSPTGAIPAGYLALEGGSFDQTVYPQLFSYLGTNVLPDYRNRVLRGQGTLTGAFGTLQEDAMQRITGKIYNNALTGSGDGVFTGGYQVTPATYAGAASGQRFDIPFDSGNSPGARVSDAETRVKAAIGRFVIKAYAAIVDTGTASLIAIEAAQQWMVRFDAQVLTEAQKQQASTNIGQRWVTLVQAELSAPAAALQSIGTLSTQYRRLRFDVGGLTVNSSTALVCQLGTAGTWFTGTYSNQTLQAGNTNLNSIVTTSSSFAILAGHAVGLNNNVVYGGASAHGYIDNWNRPTARKNFQHLARYLNPAESVYWLETTTTNVGVAGAYDSLRIFAGSGNLAAGTWLSIEGLL